VQNVLGGNEEGKKMIYLDHAATTPIDKDVQKEIARSLSEVWGNPSSIYAKGREAKQAVFESREKIAKILGAENPTEIIFTSGATESNNLAIKGTVFYASKVLGVKPHIIVSSIEHHCVLDTAKYLEKYFDVEVTYLPVSNEGLVAPKDIYNSIKDNTILVSIMHGNNEVGAIEPIGEISKVIKRAKEERNGDLPLYFHSDAVQAFQYNESDVSELGVDLLSLTGHKFYGPKGVGLLYVHRGTKILPQQQGGAQERGLRAGTENVPYIVGMAVAMEKAKSEMAKSIKTVTDLRDYLEERIIKEIPEVELLGPKDKAARLPHITSVIFKRIEGESILIKLDMEGIAASSGSACTSGSLEPSHVTKAMGYGDMEAHGAVRFSLGKLNKKEDIDKLMEVLPEIVESLRAMSPIKE
jgi:cysteine desulfurase